jgi:hypothetical protein
MKERLLRQSYEWQVGQPRVQCWTKRLRKELDTIALGYVWQNAGQTEVRTTCYIIKTRCNNLQGRGG